MSKSRLRSHSTIPGQHPKTADRLIREAHVKLSDADIEAVGLGQLVSVWRTIGLRDIELLASHGTETAVKLSVAGPMDDDQLSSLDSVNQWELVASDADVWRYLLEFTAPEFPTTLAEGSEGLIDVRCREVRDRGFTIALVGSQRAIAAVIRRYESVGMSPGLQKLGAYTGRDRPLDTLTDRQRTVLEIAYEMGYYDVPRQVSTETIAAELDLEASTVTEHLQRAERNLLAQHFPAEFP